jgi:hypothetical protein
MYILNICVHICYICFVYINVCYKMCISIPKLYYSSLSSINVFDFYCIVVIILFQLIVLNIDNNFISSIHVQVFEIQFACN